jgi:hypothetical protein
MIEGGGPQYNNQRGFNPIFVCRLGRRGAIGDVL